FVLRAFRDAGGNRLRWPLHRFGRHFQTGHNLHLLPSVIEGSILAYCGLHAAHTRRAVAVFDVELAVNGALAVVTVRTQIPGARQFHLAQCREKASRAQFAIACLMAARARDRAPAGGRLGELQQLSERRRPSLMQGGAEPHLHRLQIYAARLLPLGEDVAQQRGYFARDLRMDRFGRFFSAGVSVSSTCRKAQILSLTSTISAQSSSNRSNS